MNTCQRVAVSRETPLRPWRSLTFDVVRHFHSADVVCRVLDLLATLRMNVLHLHLTDDQGWRFEVPEYPELIELSSGSAVDGDPGGYFSEADRVRILEHAQSLGIDVVPEVDVPGHVLAAQHAIPGLNPDGVAPDVYTGIEVGISTLHTSAPETERFLVAALTAAREWTTNGLIHIGGDEPLVTPQDEYRALVTRAVDIVHDLGCRVVAWQEAADMLHEGDRVQVWDPRLGLERVTAAAGRGVDVLMTPGAHAYLDMKYAYDEHYGLQWAGVHELPDALEWDPEAMLPGVAPERINGVGACLFGETLRTEASVFYMLLPRLVAIATVAWDGAVPWDVFATRVEALARDWVREDVPFHRSPGITWPQARALG